MSASTVIFLVVGVLVLGAGGGLAVWLATRSSRSSGQQLPVAPISDPVPGAAAWYSQQPGYPPPPMAGFPPPPVGGPQPYPGGYQPYGPQVMVNPFESRASTVLILGILGLVLCGPILGPIAWYQGISLKREAEAAGFPEPGNSKAGRICGMIGTILSLLGILLYVGIFALAVGTSSSGGY